MGMHMAMSGRIRFGKFLAPVLTDSDDAAIAVAASRILRDRAVGAIDVIPLTHDPELTEATHYAIRAGATEWHAIRLLVEQGKLRADVRLPVRIFMNGGQWRRAGLVAFVAEAAHSVSVVGVERH
jgi:hypothetical protein